MKMPLICLMLIHAQMSYARLDEHQQQGLSDTKRMLTTPGERWQVLKSDAGAREMDQKVEALAGSGEGKEEIYRLSAELLDKVTDEKDGNPAELQKLLLDAQKNPETFVDKYFSSEQKARLKKIADQVGKRQPSTSPLK